MAYLGPPVTLAALLVTPPHSLYRQSWTPRRQQHGTVNADGFGVGWWDPTARPEPARYRRSVPIWSDRSFASMAGVVRAGAVMAAVRSATPPLPVEESGAAPFTSGRWLFSLNGAVTGWNAGVGTAVRRGLSDSIAAELEGMSDGEALFALTLEHLGAGADPSDAVRSTVAAVEGRRNLLLSDGRTIWATACGDTLWVQSAGSTVRVASEPDDDGPGWAEVPDGSLVVATPSSAEVRAL
jgi:glutamine amidotransferase